MKKVLVTLLVIMIFISMFAITACDSTDGHTHSYGSWSITRSATCTTSGSRSKTCSCGDVITATIPATGHNMVNGICTKCGATK